MVEIPRSSFIPKESSGMTPGKIRRRRTFHVFNFLAMASLVGSLALAGGAYFLKTTGQARLTEARDALGKQKSLFNEANIAEVREFDRKLQAAKILLANHISPLKLFDAIEEETKQTIQLTSFNLEHDPMFDTLVTVQGATREFSSLALQEIGFGENTILKDIVFSEVALAADASGATLLPVTFTLTGLVEKSLILYDGQSRITSPTFIETADDALVLEVSEDNDESEVLGETITIEPL